jgi:hypothetical protein
MDMGEESSSSSSYSSSSNNASVIDSSNIGFQVRLALISLCFPFCPFRAHVISFSFCIYMCNLNLNYVEYCSCSWAMNIVGLFAATEEARLERRYRSWGFRAGSFILPLFFIVNF